MRGGGTGTPELREFRVDEGMIWEKDGMEWDMALYTPE